MKYEHTKTIAELEEMGVFKITPRRISAAKMALRRQNDKEPLFAKAIPDDAALERVMAFVDGYRQRCIRHRRDIAQQWLRLRKILRSVPSEVRAEFSEEWDRPNWHVPRRPEYGLDMLRELVCRHYGFNETYRYSNITFT